MPKSYYFYILFLTEIGDRRFCLVHNNMTTWYNSKHWCETSWGGRLAVDDSFDVHDVLLELITDLNVSHAWLGGSTKILYWNWIPTGTGFLVLFLHFTSTFGRNNYELFTYEKVCFKRFY